MYEACKRQPDLRPDLIVGHSGLGGTTVMLQELYQCPVINYFEFYYHPHGSDMDFRPDFPPAELDFLRARMRNAAILLDLEACDAGYAPTYSARLLKLNDSAKPKFKSTKARVKRKVDEPGGFEGKEMLLQWGGPVGMDRLHILHGGPDTTPDSEALLAGVGFGADLEALAGLHEQGTSVRFFLGYAGWDAGQLEEEMEAGAWRTAAAQAEQIFVPDSGRFWTQMMAKLDPAYSWMQHIPPDPWTN